MEGPLVGFLIDRFDLRVMLVLGTTLAGLGFVLSPTRKVTSCS